MSKVWKDASDIKMIHDFESKKLRELDKQMREKPKFNNSKEGEKSVNGRRIISRRINR